MYPYNGKTKSRQLQISIPSVLNHSFASVLVRSLTFTQLQLSLCFFTFPFPYPSSCPLSSTLPKVGVLVPKHPTPILCLSFLLSPHLPSHSAMSICVHVQYALSLHADTVFTRLSNRSTLIPKERIATILTSMPQRRPRVPSSMPRLTKLCASDDPKIVMLIMLF